MSTANNTKSKKGRNVVWRKVQNCNLEMLQRDDRNLESKPLTLSLTWRKGCVSPGPGYSVGG